MNPSPDSIPPNFLAHHDPLPSKREGVIPLFLSISRLHIVAIACLGTFTFGWLFTGRYFWSIPAICALDWFLVNLLNRVVDWREDRVNAITGADFVAFHRRFFTWAGLSVLILSFPAIHLAAPAVTPFRLGYHLLGLTYNWPLLPQGRRIKELYFWKNSASAVGFMLTVFCYPLAGAFQGGRVNLASDISWLTIAIAGVFFFLFELSYEVIYDLRDAPGDAKAGVRTYPVVHGHRAAVRLIDTLIIASSLSLVVGYAAGQIPWRLVIMIFAPLIQLVFYKRALRRGITSNDCVIITWLGAALLLTYHLWILLDLPGARLP